MKKKGNASNSIKASLRPAHSYQIILKKKGFKNDTISVSTYGITDYSKIISRKVYLKRKPLYYATLKLKNELEEKLANSVVMVNNLTAHTVDTIEHKESSIKIEFDGDCEYIITAKYEDSLKYIYVEKKNFRITSSLPYYNLYLASAVPSRLYVKIDDCNADSSNAISDIFLKVNDWVNGNTFNITPGPEGDFQLVITDFRLFDLYLGSSKIVYSKNHIVTGNYCITFRNQ